MIRFQHHFLGVLFMPFLSVISMHGASAQEPTVYAAVPGYKKFTVGAQNPRSGIFYSTTRNLNWQHTG